MPSETPFSKGGPGARDSSGVDRVDEASRESFPASDPPGWAAPTESAAEAATDARSRELRESVGDQLVLEFDSGARIAGVPLAVRPARGRAEILILGDAVVFESSGVPVEHIDRMLVCVGELIGYHRQH